jgi:hypothetical protein
LNFWIHDLTLLQIIGATARPGDIQLQFKRGKEVVSTYPYRLEARRKGSAERRGFDSGDAIYLIVPDRFATSGSRWSGPRRSWKTTRRRTRTTAMR